MQRDKFKIREHPADAKFVARGSSLREAFANAAEAMFSIMTDLKGCQGTEKDGFTLRAEDKESLLYDFLDHLIYLRDVNSRLYSSFEVEIDETSQGYELKAEATGCSLATIDRYTEVKAVTYNEMEIRREQDLWLVTVVLDV